ncbi:hypothetical protein CRI94_15190 [Longibacter salinarum]|uniref:Uncharacterized protein n=1 Tax=Longibacter salinarum TaxID=1850348 RepID=A0A2A8CV11_9BACT|nr:hypothetical protein [Longibacter salinarum]PEN11381.1 hypothetical protein CRI94_15190 [Longibacter salinarum]
MERIVLFLVLGAFFSGSLYALNVETNAKDADEALNRYQYKELAREAATAGLRRTVGHLASDAHGSWASSATAYDLSSTPYGSGSYEVDVQPVGATGDTVDVYVLGINGPDSIRIDARYERALDTGGIPPAFRSVILTNDVIQLSGNIHISSLDPNYNANIHTNGTLSTNGNAFEVQGYGSYSDPNGNATNQEDNFVPGVDYNGEESNVIQVPEISIPDAVLEPTHPDVTWVDTLVNLDYGAAGNTVQVIDIQDKVYNATNGLCTTGKIPASKCYDNGSPVLGTTEPFVWWVAGNVQLQNVQIDGYTVLYADGQYDVNGTVADGDGMIIKDDIIGGLSPENQTTLMLRTPGDINVYGNDQIVASIWANGEVTFHGTPDLTGNILSPQANFEGNGTFNLMYAAPSTLITSPGYSNIDPVGPILIGYAEWDEEHL